MKLIPYHLNPWFELDTSVAPALLCHCEHCGVVRVPRLQVRAWLSEAEVIFLPGLDGQAVIAQDCRSRTASGLPGYILWVMTMRRCFQAMLPKRPGCEALKLVVVERDNGQWAALLIDPAIGQEASELRADGLDAAKCLAIERAMVHRCESIPLSPDEQVGQTEEYFRLLKWEARLDRPKFLRHHGPLQLRVEQIGPHFWVGSAYLGCWPQKKPDGSVQYVHRWDPLFTDLTEEAAKRDALATAFRKIDPAPDGSNNEWRDLSDVPDEDWSRTLNDLAFPGYPAREGMERWSGF